MSTSIHCVVEYDQSFGVGSSHTQSFGQFYPGVSFSNIFGLLGARHHHEADTMVPKRGRPDKAGWMLDRMDSALVVRGMAEREVSRDGTAITADEADEWIRLGSEWIDDDWHGKYRRISDPDMHSVNWITASELESVVETAQRLAPKALLGGYRAIVAAMRAMMENETIEQVRFCYCFDN